MTILILGMYSIEITEYGNKALMSGVLRRHKHLWVLLLIKQISELIYIKVLSLLYFKFWPQFYKEWGIVQRYGTCLTYTQSKLVPSTTWSLVIGWYGSWGSQSTSLTQVILDTPGPREKATSCLQAFELNGQTGWKKITSGSPRAPKHYVGNALPNKLGN